MYTGKTHTVYGIAYFNDVIYSSIKVLKRKGVIR